MTSIDPPSDAPGFAPTLARGSTNDVAAMDKTLKRELTQAGTTTAGQNWLKTALDPFHDLAQKCSGFPDSKGGSSIQLCVKKTMAVTKPVNLPTGSFWDCHIMNTALAHDVDASYGNMQPVLSELTPIWSSVPLVNKPGPSYPATRARVGTYTIVREQTGLPTAPSLTNPWDPANSGTLMVDSISPVTADLVDGYATEPFVDGRTRMNYCGIEVANTTAALYKGGAVMAYNQMGACQPGGIAFHSGAKNGVNFYYQTAPPSTVEQAMLLQGARQWGAEEGAYQVGTMAGTEVPAVQPLPGIFALVGDDFSPGSGATTSIGDISNGLLSSSQGGHIPFVKTTNFTGKGLYFTGLHPDTVLTVTVRFGIEMFPTEKDEIAMLASSLSPSFDPVVLESYQRISARMPPGVPLSENFTGEWFTNIASELGSMLPVVGKFVKPAVSAIKAFTGKGAKKEKAILKDDHDQIINVDRRLRELENLVRRLLNEKFVEAPIGRRRGKKK
jgi:hypothetical protein